MFGGRKVWLLALGLALTFLISFGIWGEQLEALFSQEATAARLEAARPTAWLWDCGLLIADIALPIPATGVMTALGAVYGLLPGAAFGALGSTAAGLIGYAIGRSGSNSWIQRLASAEEQTALHQFFERWGGLAIIGTRLLPIFPEVLTIMAGIARMHPARFLPALMLGSTGTALLFAWIGHYATQRPQWGIALALGIPALLYLLALLLYKRS